MTRPGLNGIHHLKVPVSNLGRSRSWYERVLGFTVVMEFAGDGVVRGVGGTVDGLGDTMLALREDKGAAEALSGFDPIALRVPGRDCLRAWADHLDELGVPHTPPVQATAGWLIATDDPDGTHILFYSSDAPTS